MAVAISVRLPDEVYTTVEMLVRNAPNKRSANQIILLAITRGLMFNLNPTKLEPGTALTTPKRIRITDEIYKQLTELSLAHDCNISDVARAALISGIATFY